MGSMTEIGPDDDDATVPQNIIILINDEIKKMKADALKKQLRTRDLSHTRKKAELVERLKKNVIYEIPIIDTQTMSAGMDFIQMLNGGFLRLQQRK